MITMESQVADRRRTRVFFRTLPPDPGTADTVAGARYWDDEDQAREPVLRSIVSQANLRAVAYPTLGHRDVLQVFLRADGTDELTFACALVSGARLRDMLEHSSPIVEGFALQVLPGEQLSMEGVRAGLQAWIERCFADIVLPSITVERWTGPEGILYEVLELLLSWPCPTTALSQAAGGPEDASAELEPDPSLAQPPYEAAA
jgi:hypothetical protein